MGSLPAHGRIDCARCFNDCTTKFDQTKRTDNEWRITANPLAWGNHEPEVVVLGFSKGPTQAGAVASAVHEDIPYKGARLNVARILAFIGLLPFYEKEVAKKAVHDAICDKSGRFHFGSLIRCTVERFDRRKNDWVGSGGGMLDKFIATEFGHRVASNCTAQHLASLPRSTKLVVMFGLGTKLNYVRSAFELYKKTRPGPWRWINEVSYTDGEVVVVHVEHFTAQGNLIPQWMGEKPSSRNKYGEMAKDAVRQAI